MKLPAPEALDLLARLDCEAVRGDEANDAELQRGYKVRYRIAWTNTMEHRISQSDPRVDDNLPLALAAIDCANGLNSFAARNTKARG